MIRVPLRFIPIYKEKIWGGNRISNILKRKNVVPNCGESWEISSVENDISVVSEGKFKGKNLQQLIDIHKASLLGDKVYKDYNKKFPLLIKFLDASENLSIQIHPNDEKAKKYNSFGKTEMWHILEADSDSFIYLGFKEGMDKSICEQKIKEGKILDIINKIPVKKHDTFFIPAGLIHGIGGGILLAEIQQTSDITYRFYDFDRIDSDGNKRDLHLERALNSIDFSIKENIYKINTREGNLVSCEYFICNKVVLNQTQEKNYNNLNSFIILICIKGKFILNDYEKEYSLKKGDTVLFPRDLKDMNIKSIEDGEYLEVSV